MAGGLLTNLANNQPTNAGSFASFTDANGNIFVSYSELMENIDNGSQNFRHVNVIKRPGFNNNNVSAGFPTFIGSSTRHEASISFNFIKWWFSRNARNGRYA